MEIPPQRGQLYLRLEHDQWDFARTRGRAYDAAIVSARYLGEYPQDHPSYGQPRDRLASAVHAASRPLVIDPDTPALMAAGVKHYRSAARLRGTPAAQLVELPLTPDQLTKPYMRDRFVDACLQAQALAQTLAAPYIEFRKVDDESFQINLLMIERTVRSAGSQMPIAFVQVTPGQLKRGVLRDSSASIARTGVQRVFVRVRGFGETANGVELEAFLDAQDAFLSAGVEVVPDCVGRLGPVVVHLGALGFSTGPMYFRKVAGKLLADGGGGGGGRIPYEHYRAWATIDRDDRRFPGVRACPVPNCRASLSDDLDDLREHNLHALRWLAGEAATQSTESLVRSLRASEGAHIKQWADELAARQARAA